VIDGIFSMDGDMAPLPEIVNLAKEHGARVLVDEAHATGVVGPTGRGTVEHFGLEGEVDIVLGTFSKTFAATGGFIAAPRHVTNYVRHYARSYIFTASPTPATVATVLAGLDVIRKEPRLRHRLWENVHYLHGRLKDLGFDVFPDPPQSAIMTIVVGKDSLIRPVNRRVFEAGLFTGSAAYPAVPKNEAKLRLSLSAYHTREDLDCAADILARTGREFGFLQETRSREPDLVSHDS
jgi:glycine C-acetyltransferase